MFFAGKETDGKAGAGRATRIDRFKYSGSTMKKTYGKMGQNKVKTNGGFCASRFDGWPC